MSDDARFAGRQKRFATCAGSKVLHILRAEIVQKTACIRPGQLDLSMGAKVK
jgi:hypothetical protein